MKHLTCLIFTEIGFIISWLQWFYLGILQSSVLTNQGLTAASQGSLYGWLWLVSVCRHAAGLEPDHGSGFSMPPRV